MANLVYSAEALDDLEEIARFSVSRFGSTIAEDYIIGLRETIARLGAMPQIGAVSSDASPPVHGYAYRRHRIYYDVDGHTVIVLRILHQAMNAPAHLRN